MQMPLQLSKLVLLASLFIGAHAGAQVSNGQVTYNIVDRKGTEVSYTDSNPKKGIMLRRSLPDGSFTDFKISEFDTLARKHDFDFQLASDSLISSPQGDYLVVEAMRSIAMNPEEDADYVKHPNWWKHRCGHGVNLTYLVGVVKNKAKIVKKYLTECVFETRTFNQGGQLGFEVKGYGDDDAGRSLLYLLQNDGTFVKKIGGPYKEKD